MAEQPSGAQTNAPVSDEGNKVAQEYDQAREQRAAEQNDSQELGEGRKLQGGLVSTGEGQLGLESAFVGKGDLADGDFVRQAKGLEGDGDDVTDDSWTAQSAKAYVEVSPLNVPGQTFTVDELPDPAVVSASNLPPHAIPEGLVVDAGVTDSLNASQERGGDLGTSPKVAGADRPTAAANRDAKPGRKAADKLDA